MSTDERPVLESLDEDAVLRAILHGTASETGERFFSALVEQLCHVLDVHGAWVTEYSAESRRLRALAFWMNGEFIDEYEYAIDGTPCEPVIEQRCMAHFPERVVDLFPADPDLPKFGAVSYMGVPFVDLDGRILGHWPCSIRSLCRLSHA